MHSKGNGHCVFSSVKMNTHSFRESKNLEYYKTLPLILSTTNNPNVDCGNFVRQSSIHKNSKYGAIPLPWKRGEKAAIGLPHTTYAPRNEFQGAAKLNDSCPLSTFHVVSQIFPRLKINRRSKVTFCKSTVEEKKILVYVLKETTEMNYLRLPHKKRIFVRNPVKEARNRQLSVCKSSDAHHDVNQTKIIPSYSISHAKQRFTEVHYPWYKKLLTRSFAKSADRNLSNEHKEKGACSNDAAIILNAMDQLLLDIVNTHRVYFTYTPNVTVFSKWKVIAVLGYGAFASVYKVQHRYSGKIAAGKLLEPQKFDAMTQQRIIEMFSKEIRYLVKCQCPGVVTIYQVVRGVEGWLLVEEFISGGTLWDDFTAQDDTEQFLLFAQLLQTLMELQDKGIVHRDLKPTNILRTKHGCRLCVIDFGWSETVENLNCYIHELPGTIEINPPEVLHHQPNQCKKIDNYALALNMMLLFSHQFVCRNEKLPAKEAAKEMLQSIREIRNGRPLPGFSPDAWDVFLGLSEFDAKQRFSLLQVVESSWCIRMLCHLLYEERRFSATNEGWYRVHAFLWHDALRSLVQRLENYVMASPIAYNLLPTYSTTSFVPVKDSTCSKSSLRHCVHESNSDQHVESEVESFSSNSDNVDLNSDHSIYASDSESSNFDVQSTTTTEKTRVENSRNVLQRKQWNDWLTAPSVCSKKDHETPETEIRHTQQEASSLPSLDQPIPFIPKFTSLESENSLKHPESFLSYSNILSTDQIDCVSRKRSVPSFTQTKEDQLAFQPLRLPPQLPCSDVHLQDSSEIVALKEEPLDHVVQPSTLFIPRSCSSVPLNSGKLVSKQDQDQDQDQYTVLNKNLENDMIHNSSSVIPNALRSPLCATQSLSTQSIRFMNRTVQSTENIQTTFPLKSVPLLSLHKASRSFLQCLNDPSLSKSLNCQIQPLYTMR